MPIDIRILIVDVRTVRDEMRPISSAYDRVVVKPERLALARQRLAELTGLEVVEALSKNDSGFRCGL